MKRASLICLLLLLTVSLGTPTLAVVVGVTNIYDDLNRLERTEYSDGSYIQYHYDEVGNLVNVTSQEGQQTFDYSPDGMIDTPASFTTVTVGDSINFTGSGIDPDNNLPLSYAWDFGDPAIASSAAEDPGLVQFNNVGTYTVTFTVTDSLGLSDPAPAQVTVHVHPAQLTVIDNNDPGFSTVGNWVASTLAAGYYGSDYQYVEVGDGSSTATWTFTIYEAGRYGISAYWAALDNRAPDAPYTIAVDGFEQETVLVDQRINGGQWNTLGTYDLPAGTLEVILSNAASDRVVVADAIQVLPVGSPSPDAMIIDNGAAGTSSIGTWDISGAANPYGADSVFSRNAGDTYTFEAAVTGTVEVSLWWTEFDNRCTSVPVEIYDNATLLDTVYVDQLTGGGQWNMLGSYAITESAKVVIVSNGTCTTSADAVQLVSSGGPTVTLDHIAVEGPASVVENSSADYQCRAYYTDGTSSLVTADTWSEDSAFADISAAGHLTTLEVGGAEACRISATYSEGGVSRTATYDITITDVVGGNVIIDNGASGTSSTGTWDVSGGVNPYGADSVFSRNAGDTYTFEAAVTGTVEVSLWWTEFDNRCTNVPVEIYDNATLLDTVYVDQLTGGGQWNMLGSYAFTESAKVVIVSNGTCTTSADAVQLAGSGGPTVTLDHIAVEGPASVVENSSADYQCRAYYTDGTSSLVTADTWSEDSAFADISAAGHLTTLEVGGAEACRISATYSEGGVSRTATYDITITDVVGGNVIIDNGAAGTSSIGTWDISGAVNPYGADSVFSRNAGDTYTFEAAVTGTVEVSLWWTEFDNRCTNVPVEIYDNATLLDTVYVDQLTGGGQWNMLGSYAITESAKVVIVSNGTCTTSADAVQLVIY